MLKAELGKIYTNISIYIAIIVTSLMLMSGSIYTDVYTGKEYSLFNILFGQISKGDINNIYQSYEKAVIEGPSGYIYLFSVIIMALPFVLHICVEKKNSNTRFELLRVSKNRYSIGKFFSVIISGGSIMLAGYAIYFIICYYVLPHESSGIIFEFEYMDSNYVGKLIYNIFGLNGIYVLKFILMFIYGAVVPMFAFLLSSFMKNKYLILCIPFIINYFYITWSGTITKKYLPKFSDIEHIPMYENKRIIQICIMVCLVMIVSLFLYRIVLDRKCDCSE